MDKTAHMPIYQESIQTDGRPMLQGIAFQVSDLQTQPIYTALLDTGTYHTVVGQGIIDSLGLKTPDETKRNFGGVHGDGEMKVYKNITLILPHNKKFIIDLHCSGMYYGSVYAFNMAIGMDILKHGTFLINGFTNRYTLDFDDK